MFNKVTCTAFIICALLLIAVTFHVHGFKDTYDRHINTYDEGWVIWKDANADDTCQASIFIDRYAFVCLPFLFPTYLFSLSFLSYRYLYISV